MSGNIGLTIESRLKTYEDELQSIIDKVGISFVKDEVAIESLNLPYQKLKAMDQQECCIIAYKISEYGLYIQSVYNRLENIKTWAEESINIIVGKYAKDYGTSFTKYEEKRVAIIAGDEVAELLMKIFLKANGKAKELSGVSQKIHNMSNILIELSKSKRVYNG